MWTSVLSTGAGTSASSGPVRQNIVPSVTRPGRAPALPGLSALAAVTARTETRAHDHQSCEAPRGTAHRLDHRSPAGDVESACARSFALAPATARVLGAAAASLRNSRWT